MLIHTTSLLSPPVALGKLVSVSVRNRLFTNVLGAHEKGVFPAFHRINSPGRFRALEGFEVEELHLVQDLNWTSTPVFWALVSYHMLTRFPGMKQFRTNFVVLLRKVGS